jgi:AbrB family looped-hinge helix DNA binding protein
MNTRHERLAEVRVGPQGRVVIPARMREELGIGAGELLVARIEEGRVVLERRENVLRRVRGRFATVPTEASLVDALISERREEARRESPQEEERP